MKCGLTWQPKARFWADSVSPHLDLFFGDSFSGTFFSKYFTLLNLRRLFGAASTGVEVADFFQLRGKFPPVNFKPSSEWRTTRECSGVCDPWAKHHALRRPNRPGTPEREA